MRLVVAALLLMGPMCVGPAHAVDAIVLEVREMTVAGIPVEGASARLEVLDEKSLKVTLAARSVTLAQPLGRLTDLSLDCGAPVIADPRFGCDAGRFRARGGPTQRIDLRLKAGTDLKSGISTFAGHGLAPRPGSTAAWMRKAGG
jgi:hypothetical protein